ncbi:unnamed protein product [Gadus morhua 'NCC']
MKYSYSFQEFKDLLLYLDSPVETPPAKDDEDNLVGFGVHTKRTWRDVWKRRDDGFSAFILRQQCTPGSKMFRLQDYLKRQSASEGRASSGHATSASHCPAFTEMEDDDELEMMMLSISPSKLQAPALSAASRSSTAPSTSYPPPAAPSAPCSPDPPLPRYDQDVIRWNCSHHQSIWMKIEMEPLGLWPGPRTLWKSFRSVIRSWATPCHYRLGCILRACNIGLSLPSTCSVGGVEVVYSTLNIISTSCSTLGTLFT